jgi:hypothetical protein
MLEEELPPENVSHEKPKAQATEETEKSPSLGEGVAEDASIAKQQPEAEPCEGKSE